MLRVAGVTLTDATRCCTTICAESFVPPDSVATTHVEPFATDVTRPAVLTVAMPVARLTHVNVPFTVAPAASFAVAVSWKVAVSAVRVSTFGVTVVEATAPDAVAVTVSGEPARRRGDRLRAGRGPEGPGGAREALPVGRGRGGAEGAAPGRHREGDGPAAHPVADGVGDLHDDRQLKDRADRAGLIAARDEREGLRRAAGDVESRRGRARESGCARHQGVAG